MGDKVKGFLEVGVNERREVVVNHPDLEVDEQGRGHIVFSPDQARNLARILLKQASQADGFPLSGEEGEFLIEFNTEIQPGAIQATRIRIDLVTVLDLERRFNIALCEHPLYAELKQYVKKNR